MKIIYKLNNPYRGGLLYAYYEKENLLKKKQTTMKRIKLFAYLMTGMAATALMTSCGDDDGVTPTAEPTITVTADGMVDGQITGNVDDEVVFTIATVTEGGFASITIATAQGTDPVGSETSETEVTTYTHNITVADIDAPTVITFTVLDNEGRTAIANAIVTGQRTNLQKLQDFNWQFTSQISVNEPFGLIVDGSENIKDYEVDNVYSFNEDMTASLDFGAIADPSGFDGLVIPGTYKYDEDNDILTLYRLGFQPDFTFAPHDTLVWNINEFSNLEYTGTIIYELGELLGGAPEDWLWTADETFVAVPK